MKASAVSTFLSAVSVVAFLLYGSSPAHAATRSSSGGPQGSKGLTAKAYTPAAGGAERQAIMDGLRGRQDVVFKVHYLKAHGDWAWVDVTPLDKKGKAVAEGGTSLMHKAGGAWKAMDLSTLPEDPDNPMQEPTPKFVRQSQRAFPGLPADIFPRPGRSK